MRCTGSRNTSTSASWPDFISWLASKSCETRQPPETPPTIKSSITGARSLRPPTPEIPAFSSRKSSRSRAWEASKYPPGLITRRHRCRPTGRRRTSARHRRALRSASGTATPSTWAIWGPSPSSASSSTWPFRRSRATSSCGCASATTTFTQPPVPWQSKWVFDNFPLFIYFI